VDAALSLLGSLLILATALPFVQRQAWWIRVFDFPRVQIAAGLAAVLLLHVALVPATAGNGVLRFLLLLSLALQVQRMLPYTRLVRPEVPSADARPDPRHCIGLVCANVLQSNRNARGLLRLVKACDPDVILALETDAWWDRELHSALAVTHPHAVRQPQDNRYGMLLLSRLPLTDARVDFLIQPDVPSIHAQLQLADGTAVRLHCLHPRPPAPPEAGSSRPRDAELLLVGSAVQEEERGPVIVMGDMNDVAWSHTSDLFRDLSGLLDPRIGRGFFNTFSARSRVLRFPLDHVFHSSDFRVAEFERLGDFGSDHFPVFIRLSHAPQAQPARKADAASSRPPPIPERYQPPEN
jgi:endonuclease/exonuclease/phosphatase (EEP) superfamily protein YafD